MPGSRVVQNGGIRGAAEVCGVPKNADSALAGELGPSVQSRTRQRVGGGSEVRRRRARVGREVELPAQEVHR